MSAGQPPILDDSQPPSAEQASRLLRLGISDAARPVDDLLDRLTEPDGPSWLAGVLTDGPTGSYGCPEQSLAGGAISLEQLRSLKQQGAELASSASSEVARLTALVCYFFAVASGLAHFGHNLTSRSGSELIPILDDLAAVTPPIWAALFKRAVAVLSGRT